MSEDIIRIIVVGVCCGAFGVLLGIIRNIFD